MVDGGYKILADPKPRKYRIRGAGVRPGATPSGYAQLFFPRGGG